ncbi:hypothetical protein ALC56_00171 [Trachymyrmex septentrionalis]|uniref:Uncharacterized protein n=1 Tax=Trachymyrmex septentrionalis TaxID=34720 RepID=A0A195FXD1_9HYME|nr:hypothetical protein ALC56_00171 [Trachymyrmex septentrionalis]
MPAVSVAQRPPGGIPLHAGVPVAASSVTAPGPSGRCLGGPAAPPAGSPPLPPSLQSLGGGVVPNSNSNAVVNPNSINHSGSSNNNNNHNHNHNHSALAGVAGNPVNNNHHLGNNVLGINTASGATNPLQAMASAAASLTQLNNMANGPLPPPAGPHGGVSAAPHLNGASPSPHPMPPHGMMSGSPHTPHPHMGGGGPSPHPHHPGPHMVGSPHHPAAPHPMGPAGIMGPAGMQPQGAPGICGPGPTGPMGPHAHPQGPGGVPGQPHLHNDPFFNCQPFPSHYYNR